MYPREIQWCEECFSLVFSPGQKPLPVPGTGLIPTFLRANGVVAKSGGERRRTAPGDPQR